ARDLPEAGHAWLDAEHNAGVAAVVLFQFRRLHRTRSDHAHLAAQNVEQLRQLVAARLPQDTAQRRDARVRLQFPLARELGLQARILLEDALGVGPHGTELSDDE